MKKNIISFLFVLVISLTGNLLISSCENDDFLWTGEIFARIEGPEIWTIGTDSMQFTFSVYPSEVNEFIVEAKVIVMGEAAGHDRIINLKVNDEKTTAVSGTHYSFSSPVTLKANEREASCPITIKRSPEMEEKSYRLCIEIISSPEIGVGVNEWKSLTITWNDMISKPANWDKLTEFFGDYSNTKYRFIISTLGLTQFTYGETNGMSWGEMNNYHLLMVEALATYNAARPNDPLTDENNRLVTF